MKSGLSSFDDKRFLLPNGIDTIAHGHYKANQTVKLVNVCQNEGIPQLPESENNLAALEPLEAAHSESNPVSESESLSEQEEASSSDSECDTDSTDTSDTGPLFSDSE